MSDKFFGSRSRPRKAHLVRGRGLSGEIADLRIDLADAFELVESEIATSVDTILANVELWIDGTNGSDDNTGTSLLDAVKTPERLAELLPDYYM